MTDATKRTQEAETYDQHDVSDAVRACRVAARHSPPQLPEESAAWQAVADRLSANAALIAAAPELLEAAEDVLRLFWDHIQYNEQGDPETLALKNLRSAITKAKGNDNAQG